MGNETRQLRGGAMLMLTALIWGTAFVAQSVGMDYLGPCAFTAVRNFIGCVALLPVIGLASRLRSGAPAGRGRPRSGEEGPSLGWGRRLRPFVGEGPPCCSRPACRPLQRERPVF